MAADFARYCFSSGPASLFTAGMFVVFAAAFVWKAIGVNRGKGAHARAGQAQLLGQLRTLQLVPSGGDDLRISEAAWGLWVRLYYPALLGTAAGTLVALVTLSVISTMLTGGLILFTAQPMGGVFAIAVLFSAIGYSLGFFDGARRLRRSFSATSRYADLRPRRRGSYRPSWIPLLLVITLVFYVVGTLVVAPYASTQLHITAIGGAEYLIPRSPATLAAPLVLVALAIVLAEVLSAHIAAIPRLASGLDPDLAARVDDLLRMKAVRTVQGATVLTVGATGAIQAMFLDYGIGFVRVASVQFFSGSLFFVSVALAVIGYIELALGTRVPLVDRVFSPWHIPSSS